jgi:hypothetical protein
LCSPQKLRQNKFLWPGLLTSSIWHDSYTKDLNKFSHIKKGLLQNTKPFFMFKTNAMSKKITTVTIDVPYKSSGGIIHQHAVSFDVYQVDDHYSLRPCLNESERQVANIPKELNFMMQDGKPVSLRGKLDGNFHIIQDAVVQLKEMQQLV